MPDQEILNPVKKRNPAFAGLCVCQNLLIFCFSFHDTDPNIRVFQEDGRFVKIQLIKNCFKLTNSGQLDSWLFVG